jgi:uncharacterized protein YndB with AHSA1/START domain
MMAEFRKTFSVAVPVDRAWSAFTEPAELAAWYGADVEAFEPWPGGRAAYRMGEARVEGAVEEVEVGRRLRWTEGPGLLPAATEITVVFEATETGTRITLTHAGFGDGEDWLGDLDGHAHGWTHELADLALYLETGIVARRAFAWRARLGVVPLDSAAGVRMGRVIDGGAADRAGIRDGDLLLRLAGAPVFDISDLWMFLAAHQPGESVDVEYVREGRVAFATAVLGGG